MEWDKKNRKQLRIFAGSSWGRAAGWLSNGCEGRKQALCSPNARGEGDAPGLQGPPLCAPPGQRLPPCRSPMPGVRELPNSNNPRTSASQETFEFISSNHIPAQESFQAVVQPLSELPPKTGSSLPYKEACSLADLPGLVESPPLHSSRAAFTKHKPICPSASSSHLRRDGELRTAKRQGFGDHPSVTRRYSPNGGPASELSGTPAQLPSTRPPSILFVSFWAPQPPWKVLNWGFEGRGVWRSMG